MRRHIAATVIAMLLVASTSVLSQDRMVLGPRQFEPDMSGKGAVLCTWAIYLEVRASVKACGLPRRPVDDAIDKAIADIDKFIIMNSSLHPTQAALEEFKLRSDESHLKVLQQQGLKNYCEGPGAQDLEFFRSGSPEEMDRLVKDLLAVPREPVMNPCL